jgi:hypothetical protein
VRLAGGAAFAPHPLSKIAPDSRTQSPGVRLRARFHRRLCRPLAILAAIPKRNAAAGRHPFSSYSDKSS